MLNKEQYINWLNDFYVKFNIDPKECHVSHGGSMLMLGLRELTDDIDLTVSDSVWEMLLGMGYTYKVVPALNQYPSIKIMQIDENIDVHLDDRDLNGEDFLYEKNIYYRNAKITLVDKLKLNRTKDQNDISLLNVYLASQFISDT